MDICLYILDNMKVTKFLVRISIIALVSIIISGDGVPNLQEEILSKIVRKNDTVLSRKRRYLMFPSGSSFQLVFCLTYTSVAVGSYFVFGHTAALAWELPSMPLYFDQRDFQKEEEENMAETTTTEMPHHDNDFSQLDNNDHNRIDIGFSPLIPSRDIASAYSNPLINFRKPPLYYGSDNNAIFKNLEEKNSVHYTENYQKSNYFERFGSTKSHMRLDIEPKYHQTHRRTRRELYRKIESFLTTLNLDGKTCLLKAICELNRTPHDKGTFVEEIFKAIFRAKPHDNYQDEDDYDLALNPTQHCSEMYSTCPGSIKNVQLLIRK